jgi:hypothetical protein
MKELRDIKLDLLMGKENPIVNLFNQITKDLKIINCEVYHKDGLEFIYHKDGEWIFYQNCKNEKFWTHYYRYWEILESEFSLEYEEIQAITKLLVEEALKREVGTPLACYPTTWIQVEEALKREVGTPFRGRFTRRNEVEEALKREVSTPDSIITKYGNKVIIPKMLPKVEEALKREINIKNRRI